MRNLLACHGFEIANMSYRITQAGLFEYRMDIRTITPGRAPLSRRNCDSWNQSANSASQRLAASGFPSGS